MASCLSVKLLGSYKSVGPSIARKTQFAIIKNVMKLSKVDDVMIDIIFRRNLDLIWKRQHAFSTYTKSSSSSSFIFEPASNGPSPGLIDMISNQIGVGIEFWQWSNDEQWMINRPAAVPPEFNDHNGQCCVCVHSSVCTLCDSDSLFKSIYTSIFSVSSLMKGGLGECQCWDRRNILL